jgi:transmembrane sensor
VIDDAVRAMTEREAAWDPLRERRVLGRIEAELDRRAAPKRGRWIAVGVATAAAAAIALVALWPRTEPIASQVVAIAPDVPPSIETTPAAPLPEIPSMSAAAIALADGSTATLHDGARIELGAPAGDDIRIEQSIGRVHYDVRPGLPRTFTVVADDVEVVVLGTAFWVTRDDEAVRVTVEHGRVAVMRTGGDGPVPVAELAAGDELRVAVDEPQIVLAPDPDVGKPRPRKPTAAEERRSVDELLAIVDDARGRADLAAAADALREIVEQHKSDPRAYGSAFQLGKIERSRGRHAAAARAFAGAAKRSPSGALSEDARAEAAISWFDAGEHDAARRAGEDYLARHAGGTHEARVQRMLQRLP